MAGATTIEIRLAGEADVADLALVVEVEQFAENTLAGQGPDRQRRDEGVGSPGHNGPHAHPLLAQAPDQL